MVIPRQIGVGILIVLLVAIISGIILLWLCLAGKLRRRNKIEPNVSTAIGDTSNNNHKILHLINVSMDLFIFVHFSILVNIISLENLVSKNYIQILNVLILFRLFFIFVAPVVVTAATHTIPGQGYPPNSTVITSQYPVHG